MTEVKPMAVLQDGIRTLPCAVDRLIELHDGGRPITVEMDIIERYAAINYMRPSEVIRMALDRWSKNARYSVELGEGVDTCQDREDPTA